MEDLNICQKPTKYGKAMVCEAVKVDMENSKEMSFKKTISSTLSLITVLFEDHLTQGFQWWKGRHWTIVFITE